MWRRGSGLVLRGLSSSAPADPLVITPRCAQRIRSLPHRADEGPRRLRVTVEAGGCGGFQYKFSVEGPGNENAAEDVVVERDGACVVTDAVSLEYLRGAVVDYQMDMMRSGFSVVANPGAESNCGCGVSFSPKV